MISLRATSLVLSLWGCSLAHLSQGDGDTGSQSATGQGGGGHGGAGAPDPSCQGSECANNLHQWSARFGAMGDQLAAALAVDGPGNIVLTGSNEGSVSFGGDDHVTVGGSDIYLAKLALSNGAYVHANSWTLAGPGDQLGRSVAAARADGSNSMVVTGSFDEDVAFPPCPLEPDPGPGDRGFLAVKLAPSGSCIFSKTGGNSASNAIARDVATDSVGSTVLIGDFTGTFDFFGAGDVVNTTAIPYVFVGKLNPSGVGVWMRTAAPPIPFAGARAGRAVAVDASDNIIVFGDFQYAIELGPTATAPCPYMLGDDAGDLVVAKLNAQASCVWNRAYGGNGVQTAADVAVDNAGKIVLTGSFDGTLDFGSPTTALEAGGMREVYVAKLDDNGDPLWSKHAGPGEGLAVAVTSDHVWVTGAFQAALDFDCGGTLTAQGGSDVFVAKLRSIDGGCLWSRRFGDELDQIGRAILIDAVGAAVVAGDFQGQLSFGGESLTGADGFDIFIARFAP